MRSNKVKRYFNGCFLNLVSKEIFLGSKISSKYLNWVKKYCFTMNILLKYKYALKETKFFLSSLETVNA